MKSRENNNFDALSDYPIMHIFSYLGQKDLMNLLLVDRKFYRIITTTKSTKRKMSLVINFEEEIFTNEILEMVSRRQFTSLKLVNALRARNHLFIPFIRRLSTNITFKHLIICRTSTNFQVDKIILQNILHLFLPNIERLEIYDSSYSAFMSSYQTYHGPTSHPQLTHLSIDSCCHIKDFFADCKNLVSLHFYSQYPIYSSCSQFLNQQNNLEELHMVTTKKYPHSISLELDSLKVTTLKRLSLSTNVVKPAQILEFLKKQTRLEFLRINVTSPSLMDTICSLRLNELDIKINCVIEPETLPVNETVEILKIENINILPLLPAFHKLKSIVLVDKNRYGQENYGLFPLDLPDIMYDKDEEEPNYNEVRKLSQEVINLLRFDNLSVADAPFYYLLTHIIRDLRDKLRPEISL